MVVSSEGCSPMSACRLLSVAFTGVQGRKVFLREEAFEGEKGLPLYCH